jgi:hypothetical protein
MPASAFEVERQPFGSVPRLPSGCWRLAGGGGGMRLALLPNFAGLPW